MAEVTWQWLAMPWLLLVPLLWWLIWRLPSGAESVLSWRAPLLVRHPMAQAQQDQQALRPGLPVRVLLAASLTCFLCALAQPVQRLRPPSVSHNPINVILVLDTSVSMTLKDYLVEGVPVDRLSIAKQLLDRYLQSFDGRGVGVVIVGSPSAVWLPLIRDFAAVRHQVDRVQIAMAGRLGALGDALTLVAETYASAKPALVLLLSDAVAPAGRLAPIEGARRIAAAGMRLHTLAVGAKVGQAADADFAGLIYRPPDLALLADMAQAGGGRMLHVDELEQTLTRLKEVPLDWPDHELSALSFVLKPLYPVFLLIGLLLLFCASALVTCAPAIRTDGHAD